MIGMKSIATFAVCKTLWLDTMFPLTSPSIGLFRQTLIGDIKLSITVLEVLRSRLQHSALSWVRQNQPASLLRPKRGMILRTNGESPQWIAYSFAPHPFFLLLVISNAGGVPGARNRSHGFADKPGPGVVLLHQCNRQCKVFVLGSIRRLACRYIGDDRPRPE